MGPASLSDLLNVSLSSPFSNFSFDRLEEELRLPFLYCKETGEYVGFHSIFLSNKDTPQMDFIDERVMKFGGALRLANMLSEYKLYGVSVVFFKILHPFWCQPIFSEEMANYVLCRNEDPKSDGVKYLTILGPQGEAVKAVGHDALIAPTFPKDRYELILTDLSKTVTRAVHFKF